MGATQTTPDKGLSCIPAAQEQVAEETKQEVLSSDSSEEEVSEEEDRDDDEHWDAVNERLMKAGNI